MKKPYKTLIL